MNVNFEKVTRIKIINNDRRCIDSFEIDGAMVEKPDYVVTLKRKIVCNHNGVNATPYDIWQNAKQMSLEEFKEFYNNIKQ